MCSSSTLTTSSGSVSRRTHPLGRFTRRPASSEAAHTHDDNKYFKSIIEALAGTAGWLVTGPAATKHELVSYVEKQAPQLKKQLIGVEAMDHPTDGELLDHARRFFKAADRMMPQ
jgi:hypothetical protein